MAKGTGTTRSGSAANPTGTGISVTEATDKWIKMVGNATTQDELSSIKNTVQSIFESGQVDYNNAKKVMDAAHTKMVNTFKMPAMPGKYNKVEFSFDGKQYTISNTPTGYGNQKNRNGRFTLTKPDGDYQDFRYGDSYGGYKTAKEAYNEVKAWVKKYYIK